MKNIFIILFIGLTIVSCNKRKIKVPVVAMYGEEEVANNSAIWFFYDDNGKLDLNEHNRISSTNWFFNVDKHLTLKEAMPEIIRLFIKHHQKSPHNIKPMKNYFTYVNSLNNHLSFYQFDSIKYVLISNKKRPSFTKDTLVVEIKNRNFNIHSNADSLKIVQPVFYGNMNFQEYLSAKAQLKKRFINKAISKKEYIITDY